MWFGIRLLINAGRNAIGPLNDAIAGSCRQSFTQGVITNIGNPKSMAFYAAVFSDAAPAHVSLGTFLSMLAVVVVVSMVWYGMVAIALSQPKIAFAYQGRKKQLTGCAVV